MPARSCAIAVMAKAPQPGRSKTRLSPPLSPEGCAALSAAFLRDITDNIALAARTMTAEMVTIDGCIAYAPAGLEHLFDGHVAPGTGFVLNSDSPTLPNALLRQAAELLAAPGDRVVLGPAEDGGYYLLGLKAPHAALFTGIDWSTAAVAEQTRARAASIGLELVELAPWYDVDDRASLRRLLDELGGTRGVLAPYPAPVTAACLARLGIDRLSIEQLAAASA